MIAFIYTPINISYKSCISKPAAFISAFNFSICSWLNVSIINSATCLPIVPPEDNLVWFALSILAFYLLIILINCMNPPGLSVIVALNE